MPVVYVDTSSPSLSRKRSLIIWRRRKNTDLVSSWLLHTELHCAAARPGGVSSAEVADALRTIELIDVTRGDFVAAGGRGGVRAADALHLTTALRLAVDAIVTYDHELGAAAERAGLRVVSPGATSSESPALP